MNCNLTEVNPYVISERVFKDGMVFLDWNESSYLPKCVSDDLKKTALNELNQYPDPTNKELKLQISKYTGVSTDFIECFNGSDSALDYTFRTLLNKKNKVLIPYPNYTQINQTIQSLGGKVKYCDITNLENQIISEKPQIVYLSVPNNPIGYVYDVMPLVKKYSNIYFIVDEAYYEYYKEYSVFDLAYRYNNLISVRTFFFKEGESNLIFLISIILELISLLFLENISILSKEIFLFPHNASDNFFSTNFFETKP